MKHPMLFADGERPVEVLFTQPFLVNATVAEQCQGKTIVLDVAFNAGSPQGKGTPEEQYRATTQAFIEALGERLVKWVDHHDHTHWADYASDPRFLLVPRKEAAACPPIITPDLVLESGPIDTLVCHGDFDGLASAAKWMCTGYPPYQEIDADSIAADTRKGSLSVTGRGFEAAMKANLSDDEVRHAIITIWTQIGGTPEFRQALALVDEAEERYLLIQENTERIALAYQIDDNVAWVDARLEESYDLTQLLLAGQKKAGIALVQNSQRGKSQITIAGPVSYDFRPHFGLIGGMPNRVNLPEQDLEPIINKLNTL